MTRFTVVGSGASAVHFARTALDRGHEVHLVDVGRERPEPELPDATYTELKERLEEPAHHFLGRRFESVLWPGAAEEYYGFPPSKDYVFRDVAGAERAARGFAPLLSFARGGLAEAWTGGCYPFEEAELEDFPFGYDDLAPFYATVARRIGVTGEADDLARFFPVHEGLLPPLELDAHSADLMRVYARRRRALHRMGCYVGRTRVAVLSEPLGGRAACDHKGRCLWGCPTDALWTPDVLLRELEREPRFRYEAGALVTRFLWDPRDDARRVRAIEARAPDGRDLREIPVDHLVLAAGALSSARIYLESIRAATGERRTLRGLMDNRQVLVPFVNLRRLRAPAELDRYQYHLLGLGLEGAAPKEYVHGQITTLTSALVHPIVQGVPFDLRTSLAIFGDLHGALGLLNVNLHDARRDANGVALEAGAEGERLRIEYEPPADEDARIRTVLRRARRALRALGCVVPPGMTHVRPMGASVHYAGMLPATRRPERHASSPAGASWEFPNLTLADGITFPFLPAKNLTFTLMANATRIASAL